MPLISTSSTSPRFIHNGGLRPWPTPSGVPVAMTSPGDSAVKSEQKAIRGSDTVLIGGGVLHLFAVESRRQRQPARIGNLVGGDEPRAERPGTGKILARGDGEFLVVAH